MSGGCFNGWAGLPACPFFLSPHNLKNHKLITLLKSHFIKELLYTVWLYGNNGIVISSRPGRPAPFGCHCFLQNDLTQSELCCIVTVALVSVPGFKQKGIKMNLSHVELAALGKIKGLDRSKLSVGKHAVDFVLRVTGWVNVAEDYERRATASIPLIRTLAAVCCLCGVTGPHAVKLILKAIGMALKSNGDKAIALNAVHADVEAALSRVETALAKSIPDVPVKGSVTGKIEVELIPAVKTEEPVQA